MAGAFSPDIFKEKGMKGEALAHTVVVSSQQSLHLMNNSTAAPSLYFLFKKNVLSPGFYS